MVQCLLDMVVSDTVFEVSEVSGSFLVGQCVVVFLVVQLVVA